MLIIGLMRLLLEPTPITMPPTIITITFLHHLLSITIALLHTLIIINLTLTLMPHLITSLPTIMGLIILLMVIMDPLIILLIMVEDIRVIIRRPVNTMGNHQFLSYKKQTIKISIPPRSVSKQTSLLNQWRAIASRSDENNQAT